MTVFIFFIGLLQCAIIWILGRVGMKLLARTSQDRELARFEPPQGWPSCALIVPVSGTHPQMESALSSLAAQNYPHFTIYLVTATSDEPAASLIQCLQLECANVVHIVAGQAHKCGQKNHNILAAIDRIGDKAEVYAFCDSTHVAAPDFLRCLVGPIARKEAAFTTGYHQVEPQDGQIITLAYSISVLFMRFMQAIPGLTQPWGGAMAMTRAAFATANVADLWASNVVDDCSLAALLREIGIRPRLCPGALLSTVAGNHPLTTWRHWLERQVLFLKFCIPSQWRSLGLACAIMATPPAWFLWTCMRGLLGVGSTTGPFLALCWLLVLWYAVGSWRQFVTPVPAISRWLTAFFFASFMFAYVYVTTIGARTLLWNNILYHVGLRGQVATMERPGLSAGRQIKK